MKEREESLAPSNDPFADSTGKNKQTLTELHLYEQGSKACQQYSELTMRIRTIAQSVQIAYAVAIGLVLSRAAEAQGGGLLGQSRIGAILAILCAIVVVFAVVLSTLNRHYSIAFNAIRDESLVPLERLALSEREGLTGPWSAHKEVRHSRSTDRRRAWEWPFRALVGLGLAGVLGGGILLVI